jgi:hypothetical protein
MYVTCLSFYFELLTDLCNAQRCHDMTIRVEHEPHMNDDPTKRGGPHSVKRGVGKGKGTYIMFMNCRTKNCKLRASTSRRRKMKGKATTRGGSTHDKVDPKVVHVRRVECQASSEPFGAKRYPPANTRMGVNHLPVPRGEMVATHPP